MYHVENHFSSHSSKDERQVKTNAMIEDSMDVSTQDDGELVVEPSKSSPPNNSASNQSSNLSLDPVSLSAVKSQNSSKLAHEAARVFRTTKRYTKLGQNMKLNSSKMVNLQAKPLRQIEIIGQLNHSTSNGFLLIANLMIFLVLLTLQSTQSIALVSGAIWPFNTVVNSKLSTHWPVSKLLNANKDSKSRVARELMAANASISQQSDQQTAQAPISQQYHYFWNHDQIEPKLVADEANKILTEAQIQTDQKLNDFGKTSKDSSSSSNLNKRLDNLPMIPSGQVLIPPPIQQQLTAMVLQMQRQQQMSMMLQPKFDPFSGHLEAQRRNQASLLSNPNKFWMSDSSHQPVIAPPPPAMQFNPTSQSLFPQTESMTNPMIMAMASSRPAPTAATMAGVPVFGPFMISPSMVGPMIGYPMQASQSAYQQHKAPSTIKNQAGNNQPGFGSKSALSPPLGLLYRRKSWPLLNSLIGSSPSSTLTAQASQIKPIIVAPASVSQPTVTYATIGAQSQTPPMPLLNLNPQAVTFLDATSSQLLNVLSNQIQAKATQQRIAQALAQLMMDQQQQQQQEGFQMSPTNIAALANTTSMASQLIALPSQIALDLASTIPLLSSLKLNDPELLNNLTMVTGLPFGSRLKRRHLNLQNKKQSGQPLKYSNPPYSVLDNLKKDDDFNSINSSILDVDIPKPVEQEHLGDSGEDRQQNHMLTSNKANKSRIVKKDSPVSAGSSEYSATKSKAPAKSKGIAEYRRLLMIMTTDNPLSGDKFVMSNNGDQEEQTQLRRLKRATDLEWASPRKSGLNSQRQALSFSAKTSEWAPMNDQNLLKRQAELDKLRHNDDANSDSIKDSTKTTLSTIKSDEIKTVEVPASTSDGFKPIQTSSRQEKSFKIKKLNGFASVMHHQSSSKQNFDRQSKPHAQAVGSVHVANLNDRPAELKSLPSGDVSVISNQDQIDPMLLSSAKVVNYFQNVEADPTTTTTTTTTTTPRPVQKQFSTNQNPPQLNVGFSAPNVRQIDLKRQIPSQKPQQNQRVLSYPDLGPAQSTLTTVNLNRQSNLSSSQQQRQQQQQQLLQAAANSADISSAATGTQQAYANLNQKSSQSSMNVGATNGFARQNAGLSSSRQEQVTYLKPQESKFSSNRNSYISGTGNNSNGNDRTMTSADQSAIYNSEEIMSPMSALNQEPRQSGDLNQSIGNEQSSNYELSTSEQAQLNGLQQSGQDQTSLLNNGQFNSNAFDNNAGSLKSSMMGSSSNGDNSPFDPAAMDLTRFSQQQQQQQQAAMASNQPTMGDSNPNGLQSEAPTSPDTSAFNSAANQVVQELQQQQQQMQQQGANQLALAQSAKPISAQQEFYSQQMQALGNVVNSYNQQRFNQHLREAAAANLLSSNNRASGGQQQVSSSLLQEALRSNPATYQQLQNSGLLFTPEDESAAANAAAAAGIPSYPNQAQLLAMQSQSPSLNYLSNLLMAGSEKREHQGGEEEEQNETGSGGSGKGGKNQSGSKGKSKKKGFKQVSHHYHFNSFGSPFEDPDVASFGPLNPLDIANNLQTQEGLRAQQHQQQLQQQSKKNKENENEEKEQEEEKPKKKSLLRRFSLKNLFKRFKKDKKKETANSSNDDNNSSSEKR